MQHDLWSCSLVCGKDQDLRSCSLVVWSWHSCRLADRSEHNENDVSYAEEFSKTGYIRGDN